VHAHVHARVSGQHRVSAGHHRTLHPESAPRSLRIVTLDHAVASDGLASGDIDVLLGLPAAMSREIRSEPAYTDRLVCAMWRTSAPTRTKLTLKRFLDARHVEVALQGTRAIDYVESVLSPLGHRRSIALSVPQFALAARCIVGTPYFTMLPARMAKRSRFVPAHQRI
jgi:LysR substrate binding domain